MNLIPWRKREERDFSQVVPFQQYVDWLGYQGTFYPFTAFPQQTLRNEREEIGAGYTGLAGALLSNAVVAACMERRRSHFSEARFIFRRKRGGLLGDMFSTDALAILEEPYGPGSGSGDLLSNMIQDSDLAGNSFHVRIQDRLYRLRPDWTAIVLEDRYRRESWTPGDPGTQAAGYVYWPNGRTNEGPAMAFAPEQVAHFAPLPDPLGILAGRSWLRSVIRDIQADSLMTATKLSVMEQGMTPNMVIKLPEISQQNFTEVVETIRRDHEGSSNRGKTLFLTGGADAQVVGANFQQADYKVVQGAGETRICIAAQVPAVLAGVSEGLAGSSLNAGNYDAARRLFAETLLQLWINAGEALSSVVAVPSDAQLGVNTKDVSFMKENLKDVADVQAAQASAWSTYVTGGMDSDAAVMALMADDLSSLLGKHNGLPSVQQQEPSVNGKSNGQVALPVGGTA